MSTGDNQIQSNINRPDTLHNDLLCRVLNGATVDVPPVWLMRQAGRYLPEYQEIRKKFPNFISLCRSPDATTELALQPLRRFELDAAILFSDILTIADSLDMGLNFVPGTGPVISNPIETPQNIAALPFDEACDKLDYVYSAVRSLRSALGQRLPIIGFAGSPWTQSCYMISGRSESFFHKTKHFVFAHPVATAQLIEELAHVTASYLHRQFLAGADVLFVIDTWGGILSDALFQLYSADALIMICHRLKTLGCSAPVMFYSKGLTQRRVAMIATIPQLRGIGVDWTADIVQLQSDFPEITFQGNLDPALLHAGPAVTQQHAHHLLGQVKCRQRYIASLGHGILPETPIDSVHAFVDTVRNHTLS